MSRAFVPPYLIFQQNFHNLYQSKLPESNHCHISQTPPTTPPKNSILNPLQENPALINPSASKEAPLHIPFICTLPLSNKPLPTKYRENANCANYTATV